MLSNRTIPSRQSCEVKMLNPEAMEALESSQNSYTSESGLISNLKRQLMILTDEIQKKERMHALTLQRITSTCAAYKQELEEARKFIASALETKNVIQEMPFLDRHLV